jgi:hypothetical protein
MMLLQEKAVGPGTGEDYTGWYIGIGVGFLVVIVVVIIVSIILLQASRIGKQALEGIDLMDEARETTLSVWDIQKINSSSTKIWRSAQAARRVLTEGPG